jgi:hypothetical protein
VADSQSRQKAVEAFRDAHGSRIGGTVGATPYFVGVWDTVAAIGWGVSSRTATTCISLGKSFVPAAAEARLKLCQCLRRPGRLPKNKY